MKRTKIQIKRSQVSDIGLTVVVAVGSWAAATVTHRVSELHTRKKAKDLAVAKNNQNLEE